MIPLSRRGQDAVTAKIAKAHQRQPNRAALRRNTLAWFGLEACPHRLHAEAVRLIPWSEVTEGRLPGGPAFAHAAREPVFNRGSIGRMS